uniref:Cytochrome c oxidase subunit 2 n=6 Tax=Clonopsis TaxID=89388 RepID=A0A0B4MIN3_9NEOP|nr:cytochrome oxidase subunit II [Clonopsis soumiae]AHZ01606.1 cytochrome oxidase subunit II [Clonopsis sp. androgenes-35]AHZ01610.1 cytochrome oxidase subunit II [Clonopsis sp. androgenes-53]AHZ01594.1 cytochrome oxidase subunit II [Clonopsis soumiae]AHZ01602.1 cytochrome oxidase subunit II [Clonopsis soumiae]
MTTWPSIYIQDSNSPLMEQLIFFHDHIMMILMMIVTTVSYIMIMLIFNINTDRNLLEGQMIELIWTVTPALTLFFIATPSLRLLYLMDEINNPMMTTKAIGHQWYWTYEYSDFNDKEFDSYMMNMENNMNFRLLDVDNRMVLPSNTFIRMIVTSMDVIHSWTLPSSGVKIDGTPGRLNQASMMLNRNGLIFGQCSEICGTNHSFMPIVVESVPINKFIKWMLN